MLKPFRLEFNFQFSIFNFQFFLGNHPFLTRSLCSKSSCIDQNDDAPQTANKIDHVSSLTIIDAMVLIIPISAKTHQHLTPK